MLSFWEKQSFVDYDFIVIGSGIVGLSTACSILEKKPKAKVLVLEKGILPTGASTKNAGFACFGSLTEIWSDIQIMGKKEALLLVSKRINGLKKLRKRLSDRVIDYKNHGGYELIFDEDLPALQALDAVNQILKPITQTHTFRKENDKIESFGFDNQIVKQLIFNPLEGQIDTGKMMRRLINFATHKGIMILTGCEVTQVEESKGKVMVNVNQKIQFGAKKIAVCTNGFAKNLFPEIAIEAARGQVLITKPIENLKIKGTFHFEEGYYYFRNFEDRILFGGGRNLDFENENTQEFATTDFILNDLKDKLNKFIFPNQSYEIDQTWAGIMGFTADKNPILEKKSDRIFLGAGLSGMGVALGSALGDELADMMVG